jgi:hypothetical protein
MTKVKEFVTAELKGLEKGFVATPSGRESLEAFAKANGGSMDILLMQMAIQLGAKMALERVLETMPDTRVNPDTRVDYLDNALSFAFNMGRGANIFDVRDMARAAVADMFGDENVNK